MKQQEQKLEQQALTVELQVLPLLKELDEPLVLLDQQQSELCNYTKYTNYCKTEHIYHHNIYSFKRISMDFHFSIMVAKNIKLLKIIKSFVQGRHSLKSSSVLY